jgi:mono/diheme cytochrome c family protein
MGALWHARPSPCIITNFIVLLVFITGLGGPPLGPLDLRAGAPATPAPPPAAADRPKPPAPAPRPSDASRDLNIRNGGQLFRQSCSGCHGKDGRGTRLREKVRGAPDFTSLPWQQSRTDAQLAVSIREGKGAQMPPFSGKLTRRAEQDLVAFLRSLCPERVAAPAEAAPADFEKLFQELEREWQELQRKFRESTGRPDRP